jgi:hypothetical protein
MTTRLSRGTHGYRVAHAAACCCLLLLFSGTTRGAAPGQEPQDRPVAEWTDAEKEAFLASANIVRMEDVDVGVTGSRRATLDDGRTKHDAHIQTIDEFRRGVTRMSGRDPEINFRDSYKFNIAGYRLDRLIHMNMVPVSVPRKVGRQDAAVTWWVDDVQMMERDRYEKKIMPPDVLGWTNQMSVARVFTELICNTDPNLGNFLITTEWRLHLIDFTRAFRPQKTLRSPENLSTRLDRQVYEGLKDLNAETLKDVMKDVLTNEEIEGLLGRRDQIIDHFDKLIAERGEDLVLYDRR